MCLGGGDREVQSGCISAITPYMHVRVYLHLIVYILLHIISALKSPKNDSACEENRIEKNNSKTDETVTTALEN